MFKNASGPLFHAWITSHFQKNETGKTRFAAGPTYDTGFYFIIGRRHYFVTVHLIGHMQMASCKRNYSGILFGSKVYYEHDTFIILRDTLIILRAMLNNLRAASVIYKIQ